MLYEWSYMEVTHSPLHPKLPHIIRHDETPVQVLQRELPLEDELGLWSRLPPAQERLPSMIKLCHGIQLLVAWRHGEPFHSSSPHSTQHVARRKQPGARFLLTSYL